MPITSEFLNSIRDCFLLPVEVKKLKEAIVLLEETQKVLRASSIALACIAVYSGYFSVLIPAYLCIESATIASNVQEIHEDVVTTLSVTNNKLKLRNQICKNAPLFRLINRVIGPYVNLEGRTQKLIKERIIKSMKARCRL